MLTRGDKLLVVVLAVLLLLSVPVALAAARTPVDSVVIEGPSGRTVVPLHRDTDVMVDGLLGTATVEIREGAVRVSSAPCPDHVCVETGWVDRGGRVIACVPGGISVRLSSSREGALDAVVR